MSERALIHQLPVPAETTYYVVSGARYRSVQNMFMVYNLFPSGETIDISNAIQYFSSCTEHDTLFLSLLIR